MSCGLSRDILVLVRIKKLFRDMQGYNSCNGISLDIPLCYKTISLSWYKSVKSRISRDTSVLISAILRDSLRSAQR